MRVAKSLLVLSLTALPGSAFAAMGYTNCANDDGTVRRTEQEIWGANPVTWVYHGQNVASNNVKFDPTETVVIEDLRTDYPGFGETRRRTTVEKAALTLADGDTVTEYLLCKSVQYPFLYD